MKKVLICRWLLLGLLLFSMNWAMAQGSGIISATPNPATIPVGQSTAAVTVSWTTFNPGGPACLSYYRTSPSYASGGPAVCGSAGSQVYSLGAGVYQFMLMRVSDFAVLDIHEVTVNAP